MSFEPSRGALAGVKADIQRAKETGEAYDPRGTSSGWSHHFLNQKPWHPMNFKNQARKFEAEQKASQDKKLKEQAQAEFQIEQERMRTLSYLSAEDQRRYLDKQSVSFMYAEPPGLKAALAKEAEVAKKQPAVTDGTTPGNTLPQANPQPPPSAPAPASDHPGPSENETRTAIMDRVREDPFAAMLAAKMAVEAGGSHTRLVLKHKGRSPPRGGFSEQAENQQYLVDDDKEEADMQENDGVDPEVLAAIKSLRPEEQKAAFKALEKLRRKRQKEQKLLEAERLLLDAGYDLKTLKKKREKHKHGDKYRHRDREDSRGRARGNDREASASESSGNSDEGNVNSRHKKRRDSRERREHGRGHDKSRERSRGRDRDREGDKERLQEGQRR